MQSRRASKRRVRRAAVTVEAALVLPVLFFLLVAIVVGGLGIFHYQQVAHQAREATRWLAVRGSDWQKETGKKCPTKDELRKQVILPLAKTMDPAKLTVEVHWINGATGTAVDWDSASKWPRTLNASKEHVTCRVRVTVRYDWLPEFLVAGPIQLESTSEFPMAF
ncbi:MAG: pilus assembly protein [Gemmataceae bacterium]|nr:pilus assembly protein [Gemmataceae bacterium]